MADTDKTKQITIPESSNIPQNESDEIASSSIAEEKESEKATEQAKQ